MFALAFEDKDIRIANVDGFCHWTTQAGVIGQKDLKMHCKDGKGMSGRRMGREVFGVDFALL
jgi:hypothetical protein